VARVRLDPNLFGPDQPCFGCGPRHPTGLHLEFERDGDEVVTTFVPGELHQGPPGVMHGGLVLALADELGAWTVVGLKEKFGFTAAVEARLKAPVRVGAPIEGRGRIVHETSRTVRVEVRMVQSEVEVFGGELTFLLPDLRGAEKILGGPVPEPLQRFARSGSRSNAPDSESDQRNSR